MPKFKYHIFICGNSRPSGHPRGCCDPEGNENLRALFKAEVKKRGLRGEVRANRAGCLDQCEHGPCVVVYPEAVWYGGVQPEHVVPIIEKHIVGGEPLEELRIAEDCINNFECPHRAYSRNTRSKKL